MTKKCCVCDTEVEVGDCAEYPVCFDCYEGGAFRLWLDEREISLKEFQNDK